MRFTKAHLDIFGRPLGLPHITQFQFLPGPDTPMYPLDSVWTRIPARYGCPPLQTHIAASISSHRSRSVPAQSTAHVCQAHALVLGPSSRHVRFCLSSVSVYVDDAAWASATEALSDHVWPAKVKAHACAAAVLTTCGGRAR